MKLSAKQYGQALYELTKDASKSEAGQIIAGFVKGLMKNRGLGLLPKIIHFYKTYYNQEEDAMDLKIISARPLGKMEEKIAGLFNQKKVEITAAIDPEILGGVIFQAGDELLDASLISKLQRLNNVLQK